MPLTMLLDIILLVPSSRIEAYNLTSCNISCDCSHMSILFFFYFIINNLLHGVQRQTVVATFVTTYNRCTLTWS